MENNKVQLLAFLLNADRRWTVRELAWNSEFDTKLLHILHDILDYRKLAARWIANEISEVQ